MLEELRISGLGVIDEAVLELAPGLTVVTGETGAGKTMVVQGLSLLFGGRADAGRVRPGSSKAVVEGRLVLDPDHPAVVRAQDAGGDLDDDALLVTRTVGSDGRSRAHVGGRSVPVAVLGDVGELVLALHGQSDQLRLLRPAQQRDALDRFAGPDLLALRERFAATWARWRDVQGTLAQLQAEAEERSREAELLRLGLAELDGLQPQSGEDLALHAEIERLANADDLRLAASSAQEALTGDETGEATDALQLLTAARRALETAAAHDGTLGDLAGRAREAAVLVTDLAQELASYAASVDADPVRLTVAQERLAALTTVVRRHAATDLDGVLSWAAAANDRLLALDGTGDTVSALRDEESALTVALGDLAAQVSSARSAAAQRFGDEVTAELSALAMPHAAVSVAVTQREEADGLPVGDRVLHAAAHGVDDVELLLEPHPGAPARALHKGASGGELSRVMLAVEVVFAGSDGTPVMVFDEVDAGVGGAAAVEVGKRLARLARDHQVVVVTHLPQVAAFADQHLQVRKDSNDGSVTRSGIVALDEAGRVVELSRMMAGTDTGLSRGHAEELLAAAAAAKSA
ncbi:MAG: repair protein RecN, partial [Frankiales bacterium]|nr:repair protein RecN [Frankiales bacterium]